ncbi:MAG: hypothetical protein KF780_08965 [Sphingomonas sp.]|nr:hypothetical protein [Sphingomonas sp.]
MKKIGTIALLAASMLAATSVSAQTHNVGNFGPGAAFPGGPSLAFNANIGIPNDSSAATPTVTTAFTLTGSVARDCSYHQGNSPTHTIPLGAIGVLNSNNEVPTQLFNQAGNFSIEITSTSAGCNFANTVEVTKVNGVSGLVNSAAGGYDTNNFTANIPYRVRVGIQEASTNTTAPAAGGYQTWTVAENQGSDYRTYGAFRSRIIMHAQVDAQSKGLVAGTYSDTIRIELRADAI